MQLGVQMSFGILLAVLVGGCSNRVDEWIYLPDGRSDPGCVDVENSGFDFSCGYLRPDPPFCGDFDLAVLTRVDGRVEIDYMGSVRDFEIRGDEDCESLIVLVSDSDLQFGVSDLQFEGQVVR